MTQNEQAKNWTFTVRANANLEKIRAGLDSDRLAFACAENPKTKKFKGRPTEFWLKLKAKRSRSQVIAIVGNYAKNLKPILDEANLLEDFSKATTLTMGKYFPADLFDARYIQDATRGTPPAMQVFDIIDEQGFTNYAALSRFIRYHRPYLMAELEHNSGHFMNVMKAMNEAKASGFNENDIDIPNEGNKKGFTNEDVW